MKPIPFLFLPLLTTFAGAAVPTQPSVVSVQGKQLIVQRRLPDNTLSPPVAYTVKGIDWSPATRAPDTGPIPPGYRPTFDADQYGFFYDWIGRNPEGHVVLNYWLTNEHVAHYQQDIPLMAQMHVNTVRVYGDFGDDPSVYANILDTFYANHIMVVMTVPSSKADIDSGRYLTVMGYCQNHPALLMWSIGNEWNFNLMYGYATTADAEAGVNAVAAAMKAQDPNHPVSSSLGDAGTGTETIAAAVPNVDLWALNMYRGSDFGTAPNDAFTQWASAIAKPFYFSEFGIDSFHSTAYASVGNGEVNVTAGYEDQATQASWDLSLWNDIAQNLSSLDSAKSCLGGFVFSWNDSLWKVGDYNAGLGDIPVSATAYKTQDTGGFSIPGGFPDDVDNEEYFGIVDADRNPKQAYTNLQSYYGTLAPLPLASITISPTSGTVHYNQTQSFSAQGWDVFEEPLATPPAFVWSVFPPADASITQAGVFTSHVTAGTFWVIASSGVIVSSVPVTVMNAPPTVAVPPAAVPNPVTSSTTMVSVLGADDAGEANVTYQWSGSGPGSVFFKDAQNLNGSKSMRVEFSSAGVYALLVTLQDMDGAQVSGSVQVTVAQTLTALTGLSPATAIVHAGDQQPFTVSALDQFDNPMSVAGVGQWSVTGDNQVTSAGRFTAGPSAGTFTISFTDGVLTASSMITVDVLSPPANVILPSVRVYPNPWRSDRHSGLPLTFAGLTSRAVVKIFTLSGHWVTTLGPGSGTLPWNLTNSAGDRVASGLYLYVITDDQGQKISGKFAVIR